MRIGRFLALAILAAVLMPSPPPGDPLLARTASRDGHTGDTAAGASELALAAMAAASDVGGFCRRQPLSCDIAGRFWSDFKLRLRYTIRLVYEWAGGEAPARPALTAPPALRPAAGEDVRRGPVRTVVPPRGTPRDGAARGAFPLPPDRLITGSTRRIARNRSTERPHGSENTLTIEDILVPWNGPREG